MDPSPLEHRMGPLTTDVAPQAWYAHLQNWGGPSQASHALWVSTGLKWTHQTCDEPPILWAPQARDVPIRPAEPLGLGCVPGPEMDPSPLEH